MQVPLGSTYVEREGSSSVFLNISLQTINRLTYLT